VGVDEQKAGGANLVAQRRDSAKQDGAVRAVEQREALLVERPADTAIDAVDHGQQRRLVGEPAGTSGWVRSRCGDVRRDGSVGQRRGQTRITQSGRRLGLTAGSPGTVEAHPDQI
jgi:hypothetical protein